MRPDDQRLRRFHVARLFIIFLGADLSEQWMTDSIDQLLETQHRKMEQWGWSEERILGAQAVMEEWLERDFDLFISSREEHGPQFKLTLL